MKVFASNKGLLDSLTCHHCAIGACPIAAQATLLSYRLFLPQGVTERFVTVPEEVLEVIEEGRANRRVAVTSMYA